MSGVTKEIRLSDLPVKGKVMLNNQDDSITALDNSLVQIEITGSDVIRTLAKHAINTIKEIGMPTVVVACSEPDEAQCYWDNLTSVGEPLRVVERMIVVTAYNEHDLFLCFTSVDKYTLTQYQTKELRLVL